MYGGNSIVDFLTSTGQRSDFATRAQLAASRGIAGYTGSAQQNIQLLNMLRGTAQAAQASAPQPTARPATPTAQPTAQPQAGAGGGMTPEGVPISELPPDLIFNGQLDVSNPDKQTRYQQLVQSRGQRTSAGSGAMVTMPSINLPEIYDNLFKSSGITAIEEELSGKTRSYNEAVAKIKDNPYLSEATMSGRLRKIDDKFNADTQAIRNDIATKKADIETKLNIQMKQFDINSTQARQALDQFQTLLASGALNDASGEDIANITRSTGLSSSMINSAIKANRAKDVQTSTIQFDDGTNQGFMVINSNTGEIINRQIIAESKPKSASVVDQRTEDARVNQENLISDIQRGATLRDLINHYAVSGGLSVEEIYRIYNIHSPYGTAEEDIDDVKQGKFVS